MSQERKPSEEDGDSLVFVEYDPQWPLYFQEEREKIIQIYPGEPLEIEHIGSTAVPGLIAKNIIDMIMGLSVFKITDEFIAKLMNIGYEYEFTRHEWALFNRRIPGGVGFNLHVIKYGSKPWNDHMYFVKSLRESQALRDEYERLKRELAEKSSNIVEYSDGKTEFIQNILKKMPI